MTFAIILTQDWSIIKYQHYKNKQQNKIKSAFSGQWQSTIYTACIYVNADVNIKCKNYALVIIENGRSCNALNDFLMEELSEVYSISTVRFRSEWCTSQFRSKYVFHITAEYDNNMKIERYCFEQIMINDH